MTTRIEQLTRDFFAEVFDEEPIYNYRPDWLNNPKTGKNFEIDIYYEKEKLAIEVNGVFHKIKTIKLRDIWKRQRCKERGVWYLEIKDVNDLWSLKNRHFRDFRFTHGLWEDLKFYRPNKKAFEKSFLKAKRKEDYKAHWIPIFESEKAEREMNRQRILRRQQQ